MLFLRVGSNHPRMRQLIIVLIIKHEWQRFDFRHSLVI
jgi:hypothetical protein